LVEVQALDIQRLHLKFRGGWLDWDLRSVLRAAGWLASLLDCAERDDLTIEARQAILADNAKGFFALW